MRSFLAIFLGCLLSATVAQAAGPFGTIRVGNWSGGGYTNDSNGSFTGCIVSASYQSGIVLGILVTPQFAWKLAFTKDSWSNNTGSHFPIALSFDGSSAFNVIGTAVNRTMVIVDMPDNSSLIRRFRAGRKMTAVTGGAAFYFDLSGTSAVLPALVDCTTTINNHGLRAARVFGNGSRLSQSDSPAIPKVTETSSLRPEASPPMSAELQLEALEVASNFIVKASLDNPKILSRAETPVSLVSAGAAWKSDTATGFVRILPVSSDITGIDVAATVVGNDAKECKGKFMSARNSELVDSQVLFRGMSSCEDSEKAVISEYYIIPRKKGGYTMFSFVLPMKASEAAASAPSREKRNTDIRNAAFTSVGR